ncbi:hypothetical protein HPULCUR_004870 [Helicostylum pulchrum]|uniref:Beta-lactamase n=1 Tax=Helicostylum pulchrum TaxID=562976 RepID=A0ABP9XXF8_9FUNG
MASIYHQRPELNTKFFETGKRYYDKKNYQKAMICFVDALDGGHVGSQAYVGRMYYGGLGIARDYNTALFWFKLAGGNGDAEAQRMVGVIYYDGKVSGTPDYQQAVEWFCKSANNSNSISYSYAATGITYFKGNGKTNDHKVASDWLNIASDKGEIDTFYMIGLIYRSGGYGVDRDFDLAETWFMKGICKQNPYSIYGMGELYGLRSDSKQSWENAFDWCMKAADYNVSRAQNFIGEMYQNGLGREKDYNMAMEWYQKAEKNWYLDSIASIGRMYHYGYGVSIDYAEALKRYQAAGNRGSALNGIGLLYQSGLGIAQSHSIAMSYFEKAADVQSGAAFNSLGNVYKYGYDRDVDLETAFKYYAKSADLFCQNGMLNLGLMYMEGSGTEVNRDQALYWLQRADLFGNKIAKKYIDKITMSSAQTSQNTHSKEVIELLIQEKRLQGIQLQSMEEKLAILMAENELLKKNATTNEITDKKPEPKMFFHVEGDDVNKERKDPIKFFHL